MATATPATRSGIVPYRVTVRQFERMIDAGVFPEGAHVELLGGILVDKMTKNEPHDFVVGRVGKELRRLLEPAWFIREEKSLKLGLLWRPEPDIAVVRGPDDRYRSYMPRAVDVGLLVEVADVTYAKDRGAKWSRFAACGIEVYWIVDIGRRQVEVYTKPGGRGSKAGYRDCAIYAQNGQVPVVADGSEIGRLDVRDLLP